jgi:hypothetical protein
MTAKKYQVCAESLDGKKRFCGKHHYVELVRGRVECTDGDGKKTSAILWVCPTCDRHYRDNGKICDRFIPNRR